MRRVRVNLSGLVQGVGVRYHTRRTADGLGLAGWVRNRPDGTVEVEAEGDNAAVEELLTWLGDGPTGSHARNIQVTEVEPAGGHGFEVRF